MATISLLALLLACAEDAAVPTRQHPPAADVAGPAPASGDPTRRGGPPRDQGGAAPPLPADNPAWEREAGPFVADARWYGEEGWEDVRMRVAGHLTAAGRDRARLRAEAGDLAGAADAYAALCARLEALDVRAQPEAGPGAVRSVASIIVDQLRRAARRDADLVRALAEARAPATGAGGLAGARARILALAQRKDRGEDVSVEAREVSTALARHTALRTDLDIDAFRDFRDRHRLRVALLDAYLDALDPLGLDERWGYWTAEEFRRQALLLELAARALAGDAPTRPQGLVGTVPSLAGVPAVRWPSVLAAALHSEDQQDDFGVTGLGALPTGDTLVDVAGWPGPRAIGRLTRLDVDDPVHRARLLEVERTLDAALARDPAEVPGALAAFLAELDAHGHGSRYYNMKQARNEGVRVLARKGRPDLAAVLVAGAFPLHNQDWACPNRAGILRAIEGRLLAEAGDRRGADAALARALEEADTFLAAVDRVTQGGRTPR